MYAHEIQKSRRVRMAETIANVKTSDRQEWEQKLPDKCVRIMTPERWDILYARNAHLKCNQRIKWEEYRISRGRQELNWYQAKYQPHGDPIQSLCEIMNQYWSESRLR